MLIKITKIFGIGIICLLAIGLAAEATVKISIGLFMVAFWGIVLGLLLMGLAGIASCWKGGR